jgi:translation initiation factor IF-2
MVKRAIPSQPIRIIGFSSLPKAGDPVICVDSEEKAELLVERRLALGGGMNTVRSEADIPFSLEVTGIAAQQATALRRIHEKYDIAMEQEGSTIRIPVVIKADADGTLAALRESLVKIGEESSLDFIVDPIGQGIGPVSVNDVHMARDSNAAIFTFNVKNNDKEAIAMAETEDVPIKSNNVIYTLLDDAKEVFVAYLPRARVERVHGKAVVQAVFNINNGADRIAGLRVLEGSLFRTKAPLYDGGEVVCQYRVMRGQEQVSPEGDMVKASSLKKVKEDVQDVRNGEECGLALDGFKDFEEGDVIECYSVSETKAIL